LAVGSKSFPNNLVTEIDRESERRMVDIIHAARPHDAIIGEEGASLNTGASVCWILDPLDGTTNFIHRYPAHSVSVGVEIQGQRALGVVHDTFQNLVYEGIVGVHARCDGQPIAARDESQLSKALIGTGFLADPDVRRAQAKVLHAVLPEIRDLRRSGCPSLDLCGVAAGRLDGFYESGLGRWDIAGGAAIAEAAGATVLELPSGILPSPLLVAANPLLLEALVNMLLKAVAIATAAS
jgi:fructose-1,6-bisphosphatase/inositol monophosphatase family enzyme